MMNESREMQMSNGYSISSGPLLTGSHRRFLRCPDHRNRSTIRHVRYSASSTISSLKCQGAEVSSSSVASSPAASFFKSRFLAVTVGLAGASSERPHVGQAPSSVIAEGAWYLAHSSHHG